MIKVSLFRITTSLLFLLLSVRVQAVDTVLVVGYCPYGATCVTGAADIETYMTAYWRNMIIPGYALPVTPMPVTPTPVEPPEDEVEEIEIVGVKDEDVSEDSAPSLVDEGYYEEMDNTRPPAPPCDSPATIEEKQAQCKVDLYEAFERANENCGAFGGTSAALAVAATAWGSESKNKYVKGIAYSIAGLAALSTELFGTSCPSTTQLDTSLAWCDLDAAKHKQGCGY